MLKRVSTFKWSLISHVRIAKSFTNLKLFIFAPHSLTLVIIAFEFTLVQLDTPSAIVTSVYLLPTIVDILHILYVLGFSSLAPLFTSMCTTSPVVQAVLGCIFLTYWYHIHFRGPSKSVLTFQEQRWLILHSGVSRGVCRAENGGEGVLQ